MRHKQSSIERRWGAAWTLRELKQLGEVPDSVLARRTGRTIKEVVAMREHRRPMPACELAENLIPWVDSTKPRGLARSPEKSPQLT